MMRPELRSVTVELIPEGDDFSQKFRQHRDGENRDLPIDLRVDGVELHLRYVGDPTPAYAMKKHWYIFIDSMREAYNVNNGNEHYFCVLFSEVDGSAEAVQAMLVSHYDTPHYSAFLPAYMASEAPE